MATDNKDKVLNVPTLRFPEFCGEWKSSRLGDSCDILMCKRIMAAQTNPDNGVPFYKIGTIGSTPDAYISQELFEEYKHKYNYPRQGEVMITCAGTVGKCIVFDGRPAYYQDSNIVWIDNPTEQITNLYLYNLLSKVDWSKLNSTTIIRIYNDDLRNLKVSYPSTAEQIKICKLFSLIDERIDTQNKIISNLQSLIKGLYEKTFNEVDGELHELGDLCQITKGQQINGEQFATDGDYYVMNGGIGPSGYYHDFNTPANTISISEGGNSCGYIQLNRVPFWSGGHCYTLLSPTISVNYLYHYLKCKESDIMNLRIGSGLPNIQKKDLFRFRIIIPSKLEQDRLSNCFNFISQKIEKEQSILQKYYLQKQHFLRTMFI